MVPINVIILHSPLKYCILIKISVAQLQLNSRDKDLLILMISISYVTLFIAINFCLRQV